MWINESTLAVYRFHTEIRDALNTSFPPVITDAMLSELGVVPIAPVEKPAHDTLTQTVEEGPPVKIDGQWVQVWEVRAASAAEIEQRKQQIKNEITAQVQARLDAFARTRGYDNIVSACSYATSQHLKYGPEGRYCVAAREQTWDVLFAIEADVIAGNRPMPQNYDEIAGELPALSWPV